MESSSAAASSAGHHRWWLPVVLAAECLLFAPSLIARGLIRAPLPKISESTNLFYPWHLFWRDEIVAGRWPFWNPFMFGGMPMAAEPQAQTFYPAHLLWLVLPPEFAFKLALLLHVLLASALMYGLVRELGGSRFGAAMAGLVYGLHGQMIGFIYAGWIHQVAPMAWAPGVIWGLCRAYRDARAWPGLPILAAAAMLGIQITSGHPEWVRYTLLMAGLIACGGGAIGGSFARRVMVLGAVVCLGGAIGGVQLLPLIEATRHSARAHLAMATGGVRTGAGLPLLSLPTLLVPRLFGPWDFAISVDGLAHKLSGSLVNFSESLVYVGIAPLALAAIAWRAARRHAVGVWMAIAIAGVLFALNDWTHLQNALDRVVPLDATFRSPARFVFLTNFALAVLAGIGASRLAEAGPSVRRIARFGLALAVVIGIAGAGAWWLRAALVNAAISAVHVPASIAADPLVAPDGGRWLAMWAVTHASGALIEAAAVIAVSLVVLAWVSRAPTTIRHAVVLLVVAIDLGVYAWPFLSSVVTADQAYAADARLLADLADRPRYRVAATHPGMFAAGDNVTVALRVRSLLGYDSFTVEEWDRLAAILPRLDNGALTRIGITDMVERQGQSTILNHLPVVTEGHIWWTPFAVHVPDASAAADALGTVRGPVVLEGTAAEDARTAPVGGDFLTSSSIEYDLPGHMRATFVTSRPGWIVFTDVFYPGWTATVNGSPVAIERAFGVFQAIKVPSGQSTVEFAFRPTIVVWGLATSAGGLLAALVLVFATRRSSIPPASPRP